jgi:hypothetical protein
MVTARRKKEMPRPWSTNSVSVLKARGIDPPLLLLLVLVVLVVLVVQELLLLFFLFLLLEFGETAGTVEVAPAVHSPKRVFTLALNLSREKRKYLQPLLPG